MTRIIISHINPPIPVRQMDWSAHVNGHEEDGVYGYGATEQEAIDDLWAALEECPMCHSELVPDYNYCRSCAEVVR